MSVIEEWDDPFKVIRQAKAEAIEAQAAEIDKISTSITGPRLPSPFEGTNISNPKQLHEVEIDKVRASLKVLEDKLGISEDSEATPDAKPLLESEGENEEVSTIVYKCDSCTVSNTPCTLTVVGSEQEPECCPLGLSDGEWKEVYRG